MRWLKSFAVTLSIGTAVFWHPPGTNNAALNFRVDTLATELIVPWDIIFLPDKTMLFTERSGAVRIYRNKKLLARPALKLDEIDLTKKMGLLGICAHPDFNKNQWIYLAWNYRTGNNAFLRVARFQFSN